MHSAGMSFPGKDMPGKNRAAEEYLDNPFFTNPRQHLLPAVVTNVPRRSAKRKPDCGSQQALAAVKKPKGPKNCNQTTRWEVLPRLYREKREGMISLLQLQWQGMLSPIPDGFKLISVLSCLRRPLPLAPLRPSRSHVGAHVTAFYALALTLQPVAYHRLGFDSHAWTGLCSALWRVMLQQVAAFGVAFTCRQA